MSEKVYGKLVSALSLIVPSLCIILGIAFGLQFGDRNVNHCSHLDSWCSDQVITAAMSYVTQTDARYIHNGKGIVDGYIFAHGEEPEPESEPLTGKALYDSYVDEIVSTYYSDLDSEYIRAIIYHESRYNPNCRNQKTDATGLMQILPRWHTQRARNLGVMDLTDPYGNILVGCDILHEMTEKYGFTYALNYFAGGYKYANSYQNKTSPYIKALNSFIALERSGEPMDIYGGE